MLVGVSSVARLPVEPLETEVALGRERPHLVLTGQRQGLTIVALGGADVSRLLVAGDLPQQSEDMRLVALLPVPSRELEGTSSGRRRLVAPARQQVGFAEPGHLTRMVHDDPE